MNAVLSVRSAGMSYGGGVTALSDVSLEIEAGEMVAWWGLPARASPPC